jgi:Domain of unknown function (DUF4232)
MSAMRGRWRMAGLALAALVPAAALGGCGSSQTRTVTASTTPHTAGAGAVAGCRGSQVAATYVGSDGATGHMELTIALRNTSRTPCRLHGYPEAVLLDGTGRRLPLRTIRGASFFPDTRAAPRLVVVAPGAVAHFGIGIVTNNEYASAHVCRAAAAALAAAPGEPVRWHRVSLRHAPRVRPCGSTLAVSPVHA